MRIHAEEENLPEKRLVGTKKAKDGIVTETFEEVAVDLKRERIIGARAPDAVLEESVKPIPTKFTLRDHRQVDPELWGRFREVGIPKIYGNQPKPRPVPAVSGPPVATHSEVETQSSLIRRLLRTLAGDKSK